MQTIYLSVKHIPGPLDRRLEDDQSGWHIYTLDPHSKVPMFIPCFWDGRDDQITIYQDSHRNLYAIDYDSIVNELKTDDGEWFILKVGLI